MNFFGKVLFLSGLIYPVFVHAASNEFPKVVVTFEGVDPNSQFSRAPVGSVDRLVEILQDRHVEMASVFVAGGDFEGNPGLKQALDLWAKRGLPIYSLTWSDRSVTEMEEKDFLLDIKKNEEWIERIPLYRKYHARSFRYPKGRIEADGAKRRKIIQYLNRSHFSMLPVFFKAREAEFESYYDAVPSTDPILRKKIRQIFLNYLMSIFEYGQSLTQKYLPHNPSWVLSFRWSDLVFEGLDDFLNVLKERQIQTVSLKEGAAHSFYSDELSNWYTWDCVTLLECVGKKRVPGFGPFQDPTSLDTFNRSWRPKLEALIQKKPTPVGRSIGR